MGPKDLGRTTSKIDMMIRERRGCLEWGPRRKWSFRDSSAFGLTVYVASFTANSKLRPFLELLLLINTGGGTGLSSGDASFTFSENSSWCFHLCPYRGSLETPILAGSLPQSSWSAWELEVVQTIILLKTGIKSNVSALVAEQCTGTTRFLKQLDNEVVIVDPAVTAQRIYMYFYLAINVGSFAGILTIILEHSVGFWAAYTLPLSAFIVGLLVIILGRRKYVRRKPTGSILLDAFKAMLIGANNGWKLDAAKPANRPTVKWDNQFIDELKRALVACKVCLLGQ